MVMEKSNSRTEQHSSESLNFLSIFADTSDGLQRHDLKLAKLNEQKAPHGDSQPKSDPNSESAEKASSRIYSASLALNLGLVGFGLYGMATLPGRAKITGLGFTMYGLGNLYSKLTRGYTYYVQ